MTHHAGGENQGSREAAALDLDLWKETLDGYRDEYKALAETWSKLDAKAQGTATIAGIFLAAVFAASRSGSIPGSALERGLLGASIVFLVASVVFAGIALRVQTVQGGPPGSEVERGADGARKLLNRGDPADETRRRFLASQIAVWRTCTSDLRRHASRKAESLRWSQRLVFVGASLALAVTIHILIKAPPT